MRGKLSLVTQLLPVHNTCIIQINSDLLFKPRVKTNIGPRSLSVADPTLQNSLPDKVKLAGSLITFHSHLKKHFYDLAIVPQK